MDLLINSQEFLKPFRKMEKLILTKILSVVALVIFIVDLFFNAASMFPGPLLALFFNGQTTAVASTFVPSLITPQTWIFYIWGIIYLYQLFWIIFSMISAFAKHTCIVPIGTYIGFIVCCILNFIWLITYSFNQIITSFIVIFLLFAAITFSAYWGTVFIGRCSHEEMCRKTKLILHIIFCNGLFLYWAWIVVAMHLNLDNVFVFSAVPVTTSAAVVLAILMICQIAAMLVDLFVLKSAMLNVLTVFPTWLLAIVAIISRTGGLFFLLPGSVISLAVINLVLSSIFFMIKVLKATKHRRHAHSISTVTSKA